MTRQKQRFYFLFLIVLGFFLTSCSSMRKASTYSEENHITAEASRQLMHYLNLIPEGSEPGFGFESRDDFAAAETGRAYQLFTLTADFFQAEHQDQQPQILAVNEWFVSVGTQAEAHALLTVSKMGDSWRTVSIGNARLAKELKYYENHHVLPHEVTAILRIRPLACDVLLVQYSDQKQDEARAYLLESARIAMNAYGYENSYLSVQEVLLMVREHTRNLQ